MRHYSVLVAIISAINLVIIFALSWSVYTFMTMVFSVMGDFSEDYTAQPLMILLCLGLSALNTPLIAVPFLKFPEKFKQTMIYCIIIPLIGMVVGGAAAIIYFLTTLNL